MGEGYKQVIEFLKNKKIALLGAGVEGISTLNFLLSEKITVSAILDQRQDSVSEIRSVLEENNIELRTGDEYLDGLDDFDILFKTPGIPRLHPQLVKFKNQENIYNHTRLFFDLCPCSIIAVTGTKGKTTTTTLIYEIIKKSGKDVHLGGNIGQPPLDFYQKLSEDSIVVLELSSFQTQDLHKSPHIGVILNVTQDHLDVKQTFKAASHATLDEYIMAKTNLIVNQTENDFAVLHPQLPKIFSESGKGEKVIVNFSEAQNYPSKLLGSHNLENVATAVTVAKLLDIPDEIIKLACAEFKSVMQRLELVREFNGIKYVNDSASTNPDSTIAAIKSFIEPIILIVGGSDKGLDYAELGGVIKNTSNIKKLVIIGETTGKIQNAITGFSRIVSLGARNMSEILEQAKQSAQPGDVILLSPAAASFDMFKNSKDRGQLFTQLVMSME